MSIDGIIAHIDSEVATLQQVRSMLAGDASVKRAVGRPAKVVSITQEPRKKKRHMSAEGRARLVAAVKARWAKQRKAKAS